MPRMGGLALYEALQSAPRVPKFLLMSGNPEAEEEGGLLAGRKVPFLQKPWNVEDLLVRAREVLDGE